MRLWWTDRSRKGAGGGGFAVRVDVCVGQHRTMFSCVSGFWVLLSACLAALCTFSFLSPSWIVRSGNPERQLGPVNFALLWRCPEGTEYCDLIGGLERFNDIPSGSWQTSAVLCSGGCVLLILSCFLAIVTLFLPSGLCERRMCTLAGYMQTAAGSRRSAVNIRETP
ncbi:hypothetical protein GDO86_002884 [Hymenochirus boettgeri]|uniref:Uncharacterized protein n=1 Tax=Hymenochirus boettgeri TaxID=247094 RepID=A0A8T2JYR0_9PIPI|nr:hypothetical protein GDO86_002884 [Hymenochirus boettgeri]